MRTIDPKKRPPPATEVDRERREGVGTSLRYSRNVHRVPRFVTEVLRGCQRIGEREAEFERQIRREPGEPLRWPIAESFGTRLDVIVNVGGRVAIVERRVDSPDGAVEFPPELAAKVAKLVMTAARAARGMN